MADLRCSKIASFGLTLYRLGAEDIEQVRRWRNDPAVREFMEFRGEITPEMQQKWFDGLDPASQYFYVIEHAGTRCGLVNLKHVKDGSGEGGIFIAEKEHRNGTLGLRAMMAMYDFGFDVLGLRQITARIMRDNTRAIRVNRALGFHLSPEQEAPTNQLWRLTPEDYRIATRSLRTYLRTAESGGSTSAS